MLLARRYKIALAAVASLTALGATAAYHELSQRPGEAALAYVPADALAAVSIDLSPSPAQVATFTSIDSALKANGFADMMQSGLVSALLPKDLAAQVAPYVQRAGAIAILPDSKATKTDYKTTKIYKTKGPNLDGNNFIGYIGLSDAPAVANLLSKSLPARFLYGWTYYKAPHQDICIAVVGDDLAVAKDPWALFKTHRVQQGAPSLLTSAIVQEARASVPADANVLFLMSPNMGKAFNPTGEHGNFDNAWAAAGIVVQGDGIQCTFHGYTDPASNPDFAQALAQTKPLRQDLMACLPSGAYGVMAADELSAFAKVATKQTKEDFRTPIRKNSGLDYDADILPALQGDAVVAAYPSGDPANPYGVNVLAVLDDQNAADPAATARKLRAFAEQQFNKQAKGPHGAIFTSDQANGATVYHLAGDFQKELKKATKGDNKKSDPTAEKLLNDKTFTWATVGNAVIVASSDELLKRALAAYQIHTDTMATDARLATYAVAAEPGAQMLMLFSPSRIAEGIEGTVDTTSMDKDGKDTFQTAMNILKDLKAPLWANVQEGTDGHGSATIFIPMDYEKVINLAGSTMNKGTTASTN